MQRASETVGAIAAALAKAQGELTNPEKSLTAVMRSQDPREGDRIFRYASLAAGLDIVRKALARQEIAVLQTTNVDAQSDFIRLTTMLAHASGEWLSSEWPVCALREIAFPRRMGAALTYARRYALFTLVGIAGEDDLDAPDLEPAAPTAPQSGAAGLDQQDPRSAEKVEQNDPPDAATMSSSPFPTPQARRGATIRPLAPRLEGKESAALRDRLIQELAAIATPDQTALWARQSLPFRDRLTPDDARAVEASFRQRLATLGEEGYSGAGVADEPLDGAQEGSGTVKLASGLQTIGEDVLPQAAGEPTLPSSRRSNGLRSHGDDTQGEETCSEEKGAPSPLAGKVIRLRDKEHLRFVATLPCLVCGRLPADAHHLRFAQPRALGRKVSDEYTVPVCRLHHREIHRHGDEGAWWRRCNIDPAPVALRLWRQSHTAVGRDSP